MSHFFSKCLRLLKSEEAVQALLLAGVLVVFLGGPFLYQHADSVKSFFSGSGKLESYADQVIATCGKNSYPPACYDKEIPKLMDHGLSMEQAFAVTKLIQTKVGNYYFCHVLGHNLAAKETAKDPSKWTSVIARCPVGMCSNGCVHGAAQERFRNEVLTDEQIQSVIPELSNVCEPSPAREFTGLEKASCYHSLGHLAMYITGAHIEKAIPLCKLMSLKGKNDYTTLCFDGLFMQIYQPLEPEDFALVKNIAPTTQQEAHALCEQYTGPERDSCNRESWPLYRDSLINQPGEIQKFCSVAQTPDSLKRCYNGVFYVLVPQLGFDEEKIHTLCTGLPKDLEAQCFANAASRLIETDYTLAPRAVSMCKRADAEGVGGRCYDELLFYATFNYQANAPARTALCEILPSPWKEKCIAHETVPPSIKPSAAQ